MLARQTSTIPRTQVFPPSRNVLLVAGIAVVFVVQFAFFRRVHVIQLTHHSSGDHIGGISGGISGGRSDKGVIRAMQRPQFILFGDSLTQHAFSEGGWAGRLAHGYCRKADVVLRGYSGYNTAWALHMLQTIFPVGMAAPALVTVFFGANDAVLRGRSSEKQHVPLEEYVRNLRTIVQHVRSVGAQHTVLIAPPPVFEPARLIDRQRKFGAMADLQPERTNEMTGTYAAACRVLGNELGVPVLDLWAQLQAAPQWSGALSDGLHLSAAGNLATFQLLQQLIDDHFPALRQENMAIDFPLHDDINSADPSAAFR